MQQYEYIWALGKCFSVMVHKAKGGVWDCFYRREAQTSDGKQTCTCQGKKRDYAWRHSSSLCVHTQLETPLLLCLAWGWFKHTTNISNVRILWTFYVCLSMTPPCECAHTPNPYYRLFRIFKYRWDEGFDKWQMWTLIQKHGCMQRIMK